MKRSELFEQHEPPPFGLERLRARMTEDRLALARRLVLVTALASGVVVAVLARPRTKPIELTPSAEALLRSPNDVEGLAGTVVAPMASSNPNVVLVRVSTLE